jgi:hypothetical protein
MRVKIYLAVVGAFALTISFGAFQTWKVSKYQEDVRSYISKISEMEQAVLLTESLRHDNETLARERNDLLEALRDTTGYDTPLPDDLRVLVERVRDGK